MQQECRERNFSAFIIKAFLFLFIVVFTNNVLAWGFKGHILVAQIAYDNLSAKSKKTANAYADFIIEHAVRKAQEQFKHYPSASNFAKVAVLPDTWRDLTLQMIFQRFHATLPASLKPYANKKTSSWHFIDMPYPHSYCSLGKGPNVAWALKKLTAAFQSTQDKNTKAVLMVFIEHFVGDIHQPLHTISRINFLCLDNDMGGNLYSIASNSKYYRRTSLHQLWDGGVGYLSRRFNFQRRAYQLQKALPDSSFDLTNNDPSKWAKPNMQYASFIYSVPRGKKPSSSYYKKGQAIVKKQITLAGYRLARLLNSLLN